MKLVLLKSTALAAVLAAGVASGAVADSALSTNEQATSGAQLQTGTRTTTTTIESTQVLNSRVIGADSEELGRVVNVYQSSDTTDPYIIVDRGASYASESRYVPLRPANVQMMGDRTLVVKTTRAEFDTAPAYDAARINEVEMWPEHIQEFWEDKYASDAPVHLSIADAVNARPADLTRNPPGYQAPGATPGAGAGDAGAAAASPGSAGASGAAAGTGDAGAAGGAAGTD